MSKHLTIIVPWYGPNHSASCWHWTWLETLNLVWSAFFRDQDTADLATYDLTISEKGGEHLISTFYWLCICTGTTDQLSVKGQFGGEPRCWVTDLISAYCIDSIGDAAADAQEETWYFYTAKADPVQKGNPARLFLEGLVLGKLGQIIEGVQGKW